jgi:MFS family permease
MGPLIGGGVATLLSLFVLSRAVADNPLYRFAQSLLIGTALGYVAAVLIRTALVPPSIALLSGAATPQQVAATALGLLLGLILLTRFGRQRGSFWANIPLAVLFGIGAALALVGAVRGTITPQLLDTVRMDGLGGDLAARIGSGILALLTLITLLTFTYTTSARQLDQREGVLRRGLRGIGRLLILLTFGVFFAATIRTYIAALVGRLDAINGWVAALLGT